MAEQTGKKRQWDLHSHSGGLGVEVFGPPIKSNVAVVPLMALKDAERERDQFQRDLLELRSGIKVEVERLMAGVVLLRARAGLEADHADTVKADKLHAMADECDQAAENLVALLTPTDSNSKGTPSSSKSGNRQTSEGERDG